MWRISDSNTVSVIDTATNKVVGPPIALGTGTGPVAVAVTPDGTHACVANTGTGTVSVIDTATNTVLTGPGFPIPVGTGPDGIAVTPDGTQVYVTNAGAGTVSVIATATNKSVATIPVSAGSVPGAVAIAPDGAHVYVTTLGTPTSGSNTVSVIATNNPTKVKATIPLPDQPSEIAVNPAGAFLYVTNPDPGNVWVIATASNKIVATVKVTNPRGVAVTPDGTHVYVANIGGTVSVIKTATDRVVKTVKGGDLGVAVTPDGTEVYVTSFQSGSVAVIATATNTFLGSIEVGLGPFAVGIIPAPVPPPPGLYAYVANSGTTQSR
jgi:YVTN family beta-propeller protein